MKRLAQILLVLLLLCELAKAEGPPLLRCNRYRTCDPNKWVFLFTRGFWVETNYFLCDYCQGVPGELVVPPTGPWKFCLVDSTTTTYSYCGTFQGYGYCVFMNHQWVEIDPNGLYQQVQYLSLSISAQQCSAQYFYQYQPVGIYAHKVGGTWIYEGDITYAAFWINERCDNCICGGEIGIVYPVAANFKEYANLTGKFSSPEVYYALDTMFKNWLTAETTVVSED